MTECPAKFSLPITKDWDFIDFNTLKFQSRFSSVSVQNYFQVSLIDPTTSYLQVIDKLEMCGKPSLNAVTRYTANLSFNWLSTF